MVARFLPSAPETIQHRLAEQFLFLQPSEIGKRVAALHCQVARRRLDTARDDD
jgi:hypothetical protein